ncbi:LysR family transcriptional regulator [Bordetella bronchialis]|uniref:LysR family transcriptional regulator n=1 Tax=Bordetella bronchialis TaxID=463025 RepID=UPI003D008297
MKLMNPGSAPPLSPSELAWLRCFDAAARCGSFTRAANELHVSQGAVSQQVKKLEDRLGHILLLRTQTGLTLTPEGEQLFAATRESFRGLETAVHRLHGARMGEPVNVSCSPSFAMFWLTLRLGSFYRAYPHLALRIVGESDRVDPSRMTQDNIAAAVRFGPPDSQDPNAVILFDEWLVPVATPAFMQAHPELRQAADLRGAHLLHAADPWEGTEPTEEWATWLKAADVELPQAALRQGTQFNHSLLAMQAALGGQGVAMGRLALVLGYLLQGRLVVPFPLRVRLQGAYRFIGSPTHPETPTLLDWLREEADVFTQQRDALFESGRIAAA